MDEHPDMPSAEDLFEPKPARPAHPKITAADASLSYLGHLAMDVADAECARLIVNTCLFDPPITDCEIKLFCLKSKTTPKEGQYLLRGLRI